MKKPEIFFVFGMDSPPFGGWSDFIRKFKSREEAENFAISGFYERYQVVNIETGEFKNYYTYRDKEKRA
ncbi:MAG: hypothetical protein KKD18_03120 [Nanoarchaeota archaeon]|nr:hypothetical protein [Nanoarchaeota archaeon]